MVRLNKNVLSDAQFDKLFSQLANLLNAKDPVSTNQVLKELLGKEERIMIAKRLAMIVLLLESKSLYYISQTLKVSPATVQKLKSQLDQDEYEAIISRFGKSKKDYFMILNTIDSILHLGGILPHYNGLDRYRI